MNPNQSSAKFAEITELVQLNCKPEAVAWVEPLCKKWNSSVTYEDCAMDTVDNVIARLAVDRIDLLKIDVEEAEKDIIESISDAAWDKIRQLVAEVHDEVYADDGSVSDRGRVEFLSKLLEGKGFKVTAVAGPPPNFMVRRFNGDIVDGDFEREVPQIKYTKSVMYNIYAVKA